MEKKTTSLIKFIIGIVFILTSVSLMFFDVDIPTPIKISFSVIGIALIATSKYRLLK